MKVIFTDSTSGELSKEESKNLYIKNRFTLKDWQTLKTEMYKLGIINFEDPFLSKLGADLVSIEYVKNQIAAH